jgi:hypothetical protein
MDLQSWQNQQSAPASVSATTDALVPFDPQLRFYRVAVAP